MNPGSNAELEVLKFADSDDFSFHWTKGGSKRPIKTSEPNVLTFQNISEKNFGFYRCDVKEAGKLVLTVYRALSRDTCDAEHSISGMQDCRPYLTAYTRTGDIDILFVLRSGFTYCIIL